MKRHTVTGARILGGSDIPVLQMAAAIALTHHEKYDGTGYPHRLRADAIPIEGRIVALADVFDALSSARCYKSILPVEKCVELIQFERGRHFDPSVVDSFFRRFADILSIQNSTVHKS